MDVVQEGESEPLKELAELDRLQDLVLEAMSTAAEAVKELGEHESLSEVSVQDKFSAYTELMKEVHAGLAARAHLVSPYVPSDRDCTALRREVAVLELRLRLLKDELGELEQRRGEGGAMKGGGVNGE